MKYNKKAMNIILALKPAIIKNNLYNINLDEILTQYNINIEEFYKYFPNKISSMSLIYFSYLSEKSVFSSKEFLKNEKSISKKVTNILNNKISLIHQEKELSIFFIKYCVIKPILIFRSSYYFSDLVWKEINDSSIDFNYYTKRGILSKIYMKSLFYWIKTKNLSDTNVYIARQIASIKIIGKLKSYKEIVLEKVSSIDLIKYLDFRHK